METEGQHIGKLRRRFTLATSGQGGYVLILAMLILVALGITATTLVVQVQTNQQHVSRDRTSSQSLAVAEAGLNQYLWMVEDGLTTARDTFALPDNNGPDPHYKKYTLTDYYDDSIQGEYAIRVIPPSAYDSIITVVITGQATSADEAPRTITAQIGRPAFSRYVMLTDEELFVGGPLTRPWYGRTHSNTGIRIDTGEISDRITCAQRTYKPKSETGTKQGVWSKTVDPDHDSTRLWDWPVPRINFDTVRSDFRDLSELATITGSNAQGVNIPYSTTKAHGENEGWYIKLLPGEKYQIQRVTAVNETWDGSGGTGPTRVTPTSPVPSQILPYPEEGVIYVNDNVWIEGTNLTGRITVASSGQLNASGKTAPTSIYIVGDITYSRRDGSVAVGLIAENNVEIPRYAPLGASGPVSSQNMRVDAAIIAQQGKEYCKAATAMKVQSGWTTVDKYGPLRSTLIMYGSVSSYLQPFRNDGSDRGGFKAGENMYDPWLLNNPPPHFPTVGSHQILEWTELSATEGVLDYQP